MWLHSILLLLLCLPAFATNTFAPFELDLRHTTIDADGDGLPIGDEASQGCDPNVADAALWATIDHPSDGASFRPAVSPTITLSGRIASPDVTAVLVSITADGSEDYSRTATLSGLSWSYVWTPASASATPYVIRVKATNRFHGRTFAGPISVRWHNSWPEGYISSPRGGDQVWGTVTITGRARVGGMTWGGYRLEYAPGTNPAGPSWTTIHTSSAQVTDGVLYNGWNVSSLSDGPYVLRLVAYDTLHTYETRTHVLLTVNSNTTPPAAPSALTVTGAVLPDVVKDGNRAHVVGAAPPNSYVAEAQLIDQTNGLIKDVIAELTLHLSGALWGTLTLPAGMTAETARLRVIVRDAVGNVSPATLSNTLIVDNAPPTLSIDIPYADAAFGLGPIVVSGTAAEVGAAGLDRVEFSPDNVNWVAATGLEQWRHEWTPADAGAYTLRVRAVDALGNTNTRTRTVTVHADRPIAYITTPAHNATIEEGAAAAIIGTARHPVPAQFNAYNLQYRFGGVWTLITAGNVWSAKEDELLVHWDTTGLNAGLYTLRLQASDTLGHIVEFHQDVVIYNPVTLMGLPDAALDEDAFIAHFVYLPDYCIAAYGDPETFTYTIVGNTEPSCGVSVTPTRHINIFPAQDWHGVSVVTVEASDGVNSNQDSFTITVHPVNDPPTQPVVAITPATPYKHDNLVCTITTPSLDVDGDPVQYTFAWYKSYNHVDNYGDAVQVTGPTTALSDTFDATHTGELEFWKCVVTPTDGIADGASGVAVRRIASPAEFAPFELDLRHSTIDADGDGLPIGDEAGLGCDPNVADAALWVTLDRPSRGANFTSAPILLTGRIGSADVTAVRLSFDGGANYTATAVITGLTWQYSWTPPEEGVYTLMARAINRFHGFTTAGPADIAWLADKPVAVITAPLHDSHITGVVNITGSALAAPTGFSEYVLDYKAGDSPAAPGGWTTLATQDTQVNNGLLHTWNTGGVASGAHALRLRVFDGPGVQVSETWVRVVIDRTVTAPDTPGPLVIEGAVLPSITRADGTVNILAGSLAPANCFVESAHILNAGGASVKDVSDNVVLHASGAVRGTFTLPAPCDTASITLALTVRDAVGNVSAAGESNPLTVDNAGPQVVITHPPMNARLRQQAVTLLGTAADIGPAGVAAVEFSDDGALFTTLTGTTTWSHAWTPTTTGAITLYARARDALGNVGPTASVAVTVSATHPAAYISNPREGDSIGEGTVVPITGAAADSDFQHYLLQWQKVGTGTWTNITPSPVTMPVTDGLLANWNTAGRDNGAHLLRLTVTDTAANVSTYDREVLIVADLTISGIPDAPLEGDTFFENTTRLQHAYLPDYVIPSLGAEAFAYRLVAPLPDAGAGVAIHNNWIDITPAAHWFGVTDVTVEVEDLVGNTNRDTFRVTVTNVNDPPTVPAVAITPAMPGDDDALVCEVVAPSTDLDNDPIQYQYDWYMSWNGVTFSPAPVRSVRVPAEYDILAPSQTQPGQFWKCVVRAHDGTVFSPGSDEDTVRVLQSSTLSMGLSSQSITLGQHLTVSGQINGLSGSAPVLFTTTRPTGVVDSAYPAAVLSANDGVYAAYFPPNQASEGRAPWQIQAAWNGDSGYRGAQSGVMAFTVNKAQPNLFLTLSHTSALVNLAGVAGFEIAAALTVAGFPPELQPLLAGRTVRLSIQAPDGQTPWAPLEAATDGSGTARFTKAMFDSAGVSFGASGVWRFRADFAGNENLRAAATADFSNTTARLTIKEGAGYAILVLGRLDAQAEGHAEHGQTTDYIYSILRGRNFVDEDIYYLREHLPGEIDRGWPVDGPATTENLQYAIETWARDKMLASPAPLYLILVDHGSPGIFHLDIGHTGPNEYVTAQEIDGWLSVLQSALGQTKENVDAVSRRAKSGQRPLLLSTDMSDESDQPIIKSSPADLDIVVVYGACYSGSFVPALSGPNRTLITASDAQEISYRGVLNAETGLRDGDFFLTEFFRNAGEGRTLKDAFELACQKTAEYTATRTGANATVPQHPQLDDNGDGAGTTGGLSTAPGLDGARAAGMDLGLGSNAGNSVGWFTARPPATLAPGGTLEGGLWAESTGRELAPGDTAWIEIKTPSYADGAVATEGYEDFQRVAALVGPIPCASAESLGGGRTRFSWNHADLTTHLTGGFATPGTYKAYYFLRDGNTGQVGAYLVTNVYVSQTGNEPPAPVTLLYPAYDGIVNVSLFLAWTQSVDPNADPVTYRVEICQDPTFPVEGTLVRDGLTDTALALGVGDGILNDHDYYWRVIPTDPYGATPDANAVGRFLVRGSPGVPGAIMGQVRVSKSVLGVPGATLTLIPTAAQGASNASGAYFLGNVSQGVYNMTIAAPGYLSHTETGVIVVSGQYTLLDVELEPDGTNHAPVLTPIGNKRVVASRALAFLASATDIDPGQTLSYSATGLPEGATFDAATREFRWTPHEGQARTEPYLVTFIVTDNGAPPLSASETIAITVDRGAHIHGPRYAVLGDRVVLEFRGVEYIGPWHTQWEHNDVVLPDEHNEELIIESATFAHAGWYRATQVLNGKTEPATAEFYLTVYEAMPLRRWATIALVAALATIGLMGPIRKRA